MSLITSSYFFGNISLPTDNTNRTNKLQVFIDRVQRKYLEKIFGYELYSLFIAELPTPTSQRFTDILNGVEYTDGSGILQKWEGLVNSELESFLAYFAYYEYSKANQMQESSTGNTQQSFENSNIMSAIGKQTYAYNEGVKLYYKLYDFMLANETDYPEWEFKPIQYVNTLNI